MVILKKGVVQAGADTITTAATGLIDTGLTLTSRAGWSIIGMRVFWINAMSTIVDVPWTMSVILNTTGATSEPEDHEEICRVEWVYQNSTGVAGQIVIPIADVYPLNPHLTVKPELYVLVESSATGQTNDVAIHLLYDIEKLTDLEVMRMLQSCG